MPRPARPPRSTVRTTARIAARLAALGAALAAGCTALAPPEERAPPPDLTLRGVHLEQYRHGALQARSDARELRYLREQARAEGDRVQVSPTSADGAQGQLSAGQAEARLKTGAVRLEGGVVYEGQAGDRMETARATADLYRRSAQGDDPVQLRGPGYQVGAPAFDARFDDLPQITLRGGVHARLADAPQAARP